jgi:Na+-transporting methylmalonyl-CoA/oxaloacetate decarboxylase gamma subunit
MFGKQFGCGMFVVGVGIIVLNLALLAFVVWLVITVAKMAWGMQ